MGVTTPDVDASLEFIGLFADETEEVILARWEDWANEGLDPVADADQWTDTREGGHWYAAVIQPCRELARLYDLMGTEVPMSAFVLWAWGTYLDDLAAVWDVVRLPATQAVGVVTFSGDAGVDITLGTTVGVAPATPEDPAPTFSTQIDAVIPDGGGGSGSIDVPIMADEPGRDGDVGAGAITAPSTPLDPSVTFVNAAATGGGSDPEADDALRVRVLRASAGKGPGNVRDILGWATGWPGVGSAKVVPVWAGPNSALAVIADASGQPLPADVVAGLQADIDPVPGQGAGTAPVGQQITVATPVALVVNIAAAGVVYEEGYSADGAGGTLAVEPELSAQIQRYLLTVLPGGAVSHAHVAGLIATYPGVKDVTGAVTLNGVAGNLAVALGPPPQAPTIGTLTI